MLQAIGIRIGDLKDSMQCVQSCLSMEIQLCPLRDGAHACRCIRRSPKFRGCIRAEVSALVRAPVLFLPDKYDKQRPRTMSVQFETPLCSLLNTRVSNIKLTYALPTGIKNVSPIPGQGENKWSATAMNIRFELLNRTGPWNSAGG